jgi:hypothetical protein
VIIKLVNDPVSISDRVARVVAYSSNSNTK